MCQFNVLIACYVPVTKETNMNKMLSLSLQPLHGGSCHHEGLSEVSPCCNYGGWAPPHAMGMFPIHLAKGARHPAAPPALACGPPCGGGGQSG